MTRRQLVRSHGIVSRGERQNGKERLHSPLDSSFYQGQIGSDTEEILRSEELGRMTPEQMPNPWEDELPRREQGGSSQGPSHREILKREKRRAERREAAQAAQREADEREGALEFAKKRDASSETSFERAGQLDRKRRQREEHSSRGRDEHRRRKEPRSTRSRRDPIVATAMPTTVEDC